MSYGDEGYVWIKIIFIGVLTLGALYLGLASVEPAGAADRHVKELLLQKGYTDVKITDSENHWGVPTGWACSDQDYHLVEFRATNMAGNPESGFVCCGRMEPLVGYSKGCTIRN